jgi:hypothetical protein
MVVIRKKESACCGANGTPCSGQETVAIISNLGRINAPWSDGVINTEVGDIPCVRTDLNIQDRIGTLKARWGVGRMHYAVRPGFYAVGNPGSESPVLLIINYLSTICANG